jgi:hypothetical protein
VAQKPDRVVGSNARRPIGRAVVDDDDLSVAIRYPDQLAEYDTKPGLLVEGWDENRTGGGGDVLVYVPILQAWVHENEALSGQKLDYNVPYPPFFRDRVIQLKRSIGLLNGLRFDRLPMVKARN